MSSGPLDGLLGSGGQPPVCRVLADDISVHWFDPPNNKTCICGKTERKKNKR